MGLTVKRIKNPKIDFNRLKDVEVQAGWFSNGMQYTDEDITVQEVAAIQEYGATINMPARTQTMYFKQGKDGINPKFAKKSESDFSQDASVGAYTITIPPRPFIRPAIYVHQHKWIKMLKQGVSDTITSGGDIKKSADLVGMEVVGDIRRNIENKTAPPLADSTVRSKASAYTTKSRGGNSPNKPLIRTQLMYDALASQTVTK